MVTRRRSLADDSGAVLIEGLLVVPILMLVMAAMVELGFLMFQWNQTVKAMQIGARQLAVSDPILANLDAFAEDLEDLDAGLPMPAAIVTVSCGAGAAACDADGMGRLIEGSDGVCDPDLAGSLSGMCDFFPVISADNVRVTYERAGLGYVGRPAGPVLTIRVESVGLTFDFLMLDALIGANVITMPAHAVTITSEDLSSVGTPP